MKFFLLAITILLTLNACRKGEDPDIKVNTFSAKINNSRMSAEETTWSLFNQQLELQGGIGAKVVTIKVPQYQGAGTYSISATGNSASYQVDGMFYTATDGKLIVLKDDAGYLKGEFVFEAANAGGKVKIEDGSFSFTK